jgi:hypothetical protein
MTISAGLRKLALTVHVTCSVGWFGAVAAFFALAVVGLTSEDEQRVRAAYIAMGMTAWLVILPLSIASPISGLLQSLISRVGLIRHYWVIVKALMTIPATIFLLLHMQTIARLAAIATEGALAGGPRSLRVQLALNAFLAMLVLLATTALSIYKPRGMTRRWRMSSG